MLFKTIDIEDTPRLEQFLRDRKILHQTTSDRTTPLHYLAGASPYSGLRLPVPKEPDPKFTELFLSYVEPAEVDALNSRGESALTIAASMGYLNVAEQLLLKGANPNGSAIISPLCSMLLSTVMFDPAFKVGELLIRHKANIHALDMQEQNPLVALMRSVKSMEAQSKISANPLYNDTKRISVYHYQNLYQKTEWLLKKGIRVVGDRANVFHICLEQLDPYESGRTIDRSLRPLIPLLQKYHAPFKPDSLNKWNPLPRLVFKGCRDAAHELVKQGFSIDQPDERGITPRDLAALNYDKKMLSALTSDHSEKSLPDISPLFFGETVMKLPYRAPRFRQEGFSTGLPQLKAGVRKDFAKFQRLYEFTQDSPTSLIFQSPMAQALSKQDLKQVIHLIEFGWNIYIEKDFALDMTQQKPWIIVKHFDADFHEQFSKEHAEFYRSVLTALNQSKASGVTLSGEFEHILQRLGVSTGDLAIVLFEAGLTPELFTQQTGRNLEQTLLSYYNSSWNEKDRRHESQEHGELCKIIKEAYSRGWIKNIFVV